MVAGAAPRSIVIRRVRALASSPFVRARRSRSARGGVHDLAVTSTICAKASESGSVGSTDWSPLVVVAFEVLEAGDEPVVERLTGALRYWKSTRTPTNRHGWP